MTPESPQQHTRINETLTGPYEKRALHWLAAHMPAWVTPDILTTIGLFASVLIFAGYALTYYHIDFIWLASFGFLPQWFGDSLDGTLARYRKIERPRYGFFVDHLIDSISAALIFIGIGISPFVRFDLAMLALTGYLLLSIYVYLITYVNGIFRISYAHLGPTEVRILAVLANSIVFFTGNQTFTFPVTWLTPLFGIPPFALILTFYDFVAIAVIVLTTSLFSINSIQSAISLSREDRTIHRTQVLEEKAARAARRQALRSERAMRKEAARAARAAQTRPRLQIPSTGRDK